MESLPLRRSQDRYDQGPDADGSNNVDGHTKSTSPTTTMIIGSNLHHTSIDDNVIIEGRRWNNKDFLLSEVSGACGDFGTLIPLLVAMARERAIYLAPTLFLTGIVHIVTGWYWDLPMPLQSMTAIAALAIAKELTIIQVTTAGVGVGLAFLLLSVGNAMDVVAKWIPQSVISGLQLGVGWTLALKGIKMIRALPWWFSTASLDCITLGILCSILCLYGLRRTRAGSKATDAAGSESGSNDLDDDDGRARANSPHEVDDDVDEANGLQLGTSQDGVTPNGTNSPSLCQSFIDAPPVGLILFALAVLLAAIQLQLSRDDDHDSNDVSQSEPLLVNALKNATATDWRIGLLSGTVAQLPLTTLNSCLSVCLLAETLFPGPSGRRVSKRSVCISIGLINCVLCPLGCMPTCHGAGGLAAQHRLGANTGLSMVVLGLFKISLSLLAAHGSLIAILDAVPASILGVLLVLSGHELAATGVLKVAKSSLRIPSSCTGNTGPAGNTAGYDEGPMIVCLITALVILGTGKAHVGTLCGWITCIIFGRGGDPLPWVDCFHRINICCPREPHWHGNGEEDGSTEVRNYTPGLIQSHQYTQVDQSRGSN